MKRIYLVVVLLSGLLLSGCACIFGGSGSDQPKEKIVVQPTDADTILACLVGNEKMSRKEFSNAYKTALAAAGLAENADLPSLVCLSLHQQASYKQFKDGLDALSRHIKAHPESAPSLHGLALLMQRIDREKIVKRVQSNKSLDEKEGLEAENRDLQERTEALERSAAQDQARIKELQTQIEQLKNIESIIKNRER
jgi:hypothetical protein